MKALAERTFEIRILDKRDQRVRISVNVVTLRGDLANVLGQSGGVPLVTRLGLGTGLALALHEARDAGIDGRVQLAVLDELAHDLLLDLGFQLFKFGGAQFPIRARRAAREAQTRQRNYNG